MFNAHTNNNLSVHIYCMFKNTIIDARNFKVTPKSEGICLESPLRKGMAWGWAKAISVPSPYAEWYIPIQLHSVGERWPDQTAHFIFLPERLFSSVERDCSIGRIKLLAHSAKQVSQAASIIISSGQPSWPCCLTISAVSPCGCIWQCQERCLSEIPGGEFYKRLAFYSKCYAAHSLPRGATLGHLSLLIHIPHSSSRTSTFRPHTWHPSSNSCAQPWKPALPLPRVTYQPQHTWREPGTRCQAILPPDFSTTTAAAHIFICAGFHRSCTAQAQAHRMMGASGQLQPREHPASRELYPSQAELYSQPYIPDHECKAHSYNLCSFQSLSQLVADPWLALHFLWIAWNTHVKEALTIPHLFWGRKKGEKEGEQHSLPDLGHKYAEDLSTGTGSHQSTESIRLEAALPLSAVDRWALPTHHSSLIQWGPVPTNHIQWSLLLHFLPISSSLHPHLHTFTLILLLIVTFSFYILIRMNHFRGHRWLLQGNKDF